jgi:putative transposase
MNQRCDGLRRACAIGKTGVSKALNAVREPCAGKARMHGSSGAAFPRGSVATLLDVFSRMVVGWQVYAEESSAQASELLKDLCAREAIKPGQVVLHSDNGGPMKGATMLATLQALGVMPSLSRPGVSNDNPFSESLFKTLKYRPAYPLQAFDTLFAARAWVTGLVRWYNHEHRHSAIRFVTPAQRHANLDQQILDRRAMLYEAAKQRNPLRWKGSTRNWKRVKTVHLNPDRTDNFEPIKRDHRQEQKAA